MWRIRTTLWGAGAKALVAIGVVALGVGWPGVGGRALLDTAGARSAAVEVVSTEGSTPARATPEVALSRPAVVLYGDSLAWEARHHFVGAFAGLPSIQVETRTFGGTATCDWLEQMRSDATQLRPGAVVVQFSGNAFTPCMQDENGHPLAGDALVTRYRDDAEAVVDLFGEIGARIYFAGSPAPDQVRAATSNGERLNDMYADVAAGAEGAEYVDAGAAVLDDGSWTHTLPCLPDEPCTGAGPDGTPANVVRAPDSVHFCPVNGAAEAGVTDDCPVWSSGAMRFGTAMAAPLVDAVRPGQA